MWIVGDERIQFGENEPSLILLVPCGEISTRGHLLVEVAFASPDRADGLLEEGELLLAGGARLGNSRQLLLDRVARYSLHEDRRSRIAVDRDVLDEPELPCWSKILQLILFGDAQHPGFGPRRRRVAKYFEDAPRLPIHLDAK